MGRKDVIWLGEAEKSIDIAGKTYIVTGANSGVGLETTRQLIKQGGHVVLACRRIEAANEAAKSFDGLKGSHNVMKLDLADLQSVRTFSEEFQKKYDRLDGLVCNAGLVSMDGGIKRTSGGLELTMGVNYFGHFLLTELLLDLLKKSAPSKLIILSSVVHAGSPDKRPKVHLEDLHYHTRPYKAFEAYAEAKVAAILYALELAERLQGTGVTTASVHPGWARSNFGQGGGLLTRMIMGIMRPLVASMTNSNEESAQTTLYCLLSDKVSSHSGAYFSQQSVLYRDKECRGGGWPMTSPNPHARDIEEARKLVAASREVVGLQ